jgi:hypothetical protein
MIAFKRIKIYKTYSVVAKLPLNSHSETEETRKFWIRISIYWPPDFMYTLCCIGRNTKCVLNRLCHCVNWRVKDAVRYLALKDITWMGILPKMYIILHIITAGNCNNPSIFLFLKVIGNDYQKFHCKVNLMNHV